MPTSCLYGECRRLGVVHVVIGVEPRAAIYDGVSYCEEHAPRAFTVPRDQDHIRSGIRRLGPVAHRAT